MTKRIEIILNYGSTFLTADLSLLTLAKQRSILGGSKFTRVTIALIVFGQSLSREKPR